MTARPILNLVPAAVDRLWQEVQQYRTEGCWEYPGNPDRYAYTQISTTDGKNRLISIHQVVARMHDDGDDLDQRPYLLHTCDNIRCVNPEHLKFSRELSTREWKVDHG